MQLSNISTTPKIPREKPVTFRALLGMWGAVVLFWTLLWVIG